MSRLIIVPCGQRKIWDRNPGAGPTPAADAYIGSPFVVNKQFALRFADRWIVLSAKYGFIDPAFVIPGPYNMTFKIRSTNPVPTEVLSEQARELRLGSFDLIIGLGGKEYRTAITAALHPWLSKARFPFAGLRQGQSMQATNRAIAMNDPLYEAR
jgi:hypothetical protein